jgi:hypothetical protein
MSVNDGRERMWKEGIMAWCLPDQNSETSYHFLTYIRELVIRSRVQVKKSLIYIYAKGRVLRTL